MKVRDVFFFRGQNIKDFEGFFEGVETLLTPKLS